MRKMIFLAIAGVIACGSIVAMASCNVTRVVTNESRYTTRGDTAVMITTKTIETYDARKHVAY